MEQRCVFPLLFAVLVMTSCNCSRQAISQNEMYWWYNKPAQKYWEGLPIGTGRFAAMIEGKVYHEKIFFNDETLWSGGPYNPNNPAGSEILKDVRRAAFSGDYVKATKGAWYLASSPERTQQYQHMGILDLEFETDTTVKFKQYKRKLSMDSALVSVSYKMNDVSYRREVFASYPNQVIAMRITADQPGRVNVKCGLESLQPSAVTRIIEDGLLMEGTAETLAGERYQFHGNSLDSKVKWKSRLLVIPEGGTKVYNEPTKTIDVKNANSVLFILAGATNWMSYNDVSADEKAQCDQYIQKASLLSYTELKQKHLADYMPLFSACKLNLGSNAAANLNTTVRLNRLRNGEDDPLFIAQYFQFGRYLLLAAARENTLAFNNHNIWLNKMVGRWDGRWTLNINLEECYWPVEITNLPSVNGSLLKFVDNLAAAGERTAGELYGCRGWCAHHGTDVWFNTAPTCGDPRWATWPIGGAWLMQQLYSHYEYGLEKKYLERIYPLLKGSAQFFLDFLVEDPRTGWLVTCPSTSPENIFITNDGQEASVTMGTSMDNQIIRDLFRNTIEATKVLQRDSLFRMKMKKAADKLPPHQIGRYGQLQEWLFDFDEVEVGHRHLSHLYACYPDDDISFYNNPELLDAVEVVLQRRGSINLGWSGAWKINLLARLRKGDEAYVVLKNMLTAVSLHPQPDDSHITPSFEGNQGIQGVTAGIAEMLIQSKNGEIILLPALPAKWMNGSVKGLRARGGYIVDIKWKNGKLEEAIIIPMHNGDFQVRIGDSTYFFKSQKNIPIKI